KPLLFNSDISPTFNTLKDLVQEADPGADYRIDRALNEACESVIQTACKHIRNGDPMILSCLMEHLYTEKMVEDCEHRLLELQYFIARDWKLDPILYKKCQGDAARLCHTHGWNETSELMPAGAVFSCLYRHAYRSVEQGRRSKTLGLYKLSRDCKVEVQRILHQRAIDVKLDPELQRRCMADLGKWCSEKSETGQELECLQDHLEDLVSDCRDVVGNLTELESEDIQIEALLMRACEPVIQSYCHEVADNQIDSGDLMECLIQNKHQKEMNEKCAVGVTHFQLVQIKDFRFSYKFKTACKEDVLKLCPNIKKKVDVVICLSTTVRNDTLQDAKEQRVSVKCRKQLRVEEVEMSEDIRLEPELYDSCKQDINRLCQNVAFGNAQVVECLKENKRQLSSRCHQKIFKLQEVEMVDPELDYQLMRVCKHMIRRFCTESEGKNVLQCLKQNKNSELMDPKCKQMITKRQITQNTDYRLNPVLKKACKADIPKFCQSVLNKGATDTELEGQVISCLKLKYADQISSLCPEEAAAQEQTGQVEECLKINLLKIKQEACKKEVLNMLKESKADIFVDPVLHTACALDIKHHCAAIPPGRGRQMSCLMEALQDKRVRLQPECKKRLQDRIDMWSYAAKVAPAEGFSDLAMQVMTSPSKNYILTVIGVGVALLFLVGMFCGRFTKRVTQELKDRLGPPLLVQRKKTYTWRW
uniref:Golgi apparatus protein 1 n=1 Tax=Poecilia mexicana TaxID=48701 RepID=A0A3B3Z070_9TELE